VRACGAGLAAGAARGTAPAGGGCHCVGLPHCLRVPLAVQAAGSPSSPLPCCSPPSNLCTPSRVARQRRTVHERTRSPLPTSVCPRRSARQRRTAASLGATGAPTAPSPHASLWECSACRSTAPLSRCVGVLALECRLGVARGHLCSLWECSSLHTSVQQLLHAQPLSSLPVALCIVSWPAAAAQHQDLGDTM